MVFHDLSLQAGGGCGGDGVRTTSGPVDSSARAGNPRPLLVGGGVGGGGVRTISGS
jgi:hypothetical protein